MWNRLQLFSRLFLYFLEGKIIGTNNYLKNYKLFLCHTSPLSKLLHESSIKVKFYFTEVKKVSAANCVYFSKGFLLSEMSNKIISYIKLKQFKYDPKDI